MDYKTKTDYVQDVTDAGNSAKTSSGGQKCVVYSRTRQCTILYATVILFIAMLMVAVVALHLRCGHMQDALADMQDDLAEHKKMLEHLMRKDAETPGQKADPRVSSISKRNASRGRRRKRQNRGFGACNNEVRQCIYSELSKEIDRLNILAKKPRIHLGGNDEQSNPTDNAFKWHHKFSTPHHHITYDPEDGCILVNRAGSYHVYSQMLINGVYDRSQILHRPFYRWYGYQTVRKRGISSTTLMQSFITPHYGGERYHNLPGGDSYRAADTTSQAAVFNFNVHDKVCVQKLARSRHVRYKLDPEASFFGMAMVNPQL